MLMTDARVSLKRNAVSWLLCPIMQALSDAASLDQLHVSVARVKQSDPQTPKTSHMYALLVQVPLDIALLNPATLQLSVPQLQPSEHYKVEVAGSAKVTDGYGQPLLPTSTDFYTMPVQRSLNQPSTTST